MRYPVNYISISNGFHTGKSLDFGWWTEKYKYQGIYACDSGTVYKIEKQPKGGNVIYIKHGNGIISCYAHLSKILVSKGQKVALGQEIGNMGESGVVTAQHLHFALYSRNKNIYKGADLDPFSYLEVYDNQIVRDRTAKEYGSKIKYHNSNNTAKYVTSVDEEGLVVRDKPNGTATGQTLKIGSKVVIYDTSSSWSRVGDNQWVFSAYLSDKEPKTYKVSSKANGGLNVRNMASIKGDLIKTLDVGTKVAIYDIKNGWAKISPTENKWVSKNYLV